MAAVNGKVVALRLARNRLRDCRADSYQLARSDSLGSTPSFQVLAGLLGKTAKSEARRPLASGDNYLNSASPVSSSSGNLDIYIISKGDKVSNKAINRITC